MKKIQSSLFIFGFLLICLGIYVRINDIHYYWESLCMGILIVLITCIPILIHKIYINKEPKKVLFAIPLFLIIITLASLGIVFLSTLKANKNSTLINMIRANTNLDNEIGEFCYISIAYPSKGTWRRRSRKNVNSNLFLIKGSTKYALIRTYAVKSNSTHILDTLIRVNSTNPDDIPFEIIKQLEKRILDEQ